MVKITSAKHSNVQPILSLITLEFSQFLRGTTCKGGWQYLNAESETIVLPQRPVSVAKSGVVLIMLIDFKLKTTRHQVDRCEIFTSAQSGRIHSECRLVPHYRSSSTD